MLRRVSLQQSFVAYSHGRGSKRVTVVSLVWRISLYGVAFVSKIKIDLLCKIDWQID